MPAEFDCAECGAHVVQIVADAPPQIALCCHCIWLPGWFNDPTLVRMLAPERLAPDRRLRQRALCLLLCVPGALLHILAITAHSRRIWKANDRMVDFLHRLWTGKPNGSRGE